MEAYLDVSCRCDDAELRAVIMSCLSIDGPVFEEDVEPRYVGVFQILEYIDPPDDLVGMSDGIFELSWMLKDVDFHEEASGILMKLDKAGAAEVVGKIQADDFKRKLTVINHQIETGR